MLAGKFFQNEHHGRGSGAKAVQSASAYEAKTDAKEGKYGSPAVFASQMQLIDSLLSASGHGGLGMFLHAHSVNFGAMICNWIEKHTRVRIMGIFSRLTLGLPFASAFIQYVPSPRHKQNSSFLQRAAVDVQRPSHLFLRSTHVGPVACCAPEGLPGESLK